METATFTNPKTGKKQTVKFNKGALHRQLKYSGTESLNAVMEKIKNSTIGQIVMLPSPINKKRKVTKLLKERAVFGLNLQGLARSTNQSY